MGVLGEWGFDEDAKAAQGCFRMAGIVASSPALWMLVIT